MQQTLEPIKTRGGTLVPVGFHVGLEAMEQDRPLDERERRIILVTDMDTPGERELKEEMDKVAACGV